MRVRQSLTQCRGDGRALTVAVDDPTLAEPPLQVLPESASAGISTHAAVNLPTVASTKVHCQGGNRVTVAMQSFVKGSLGNHKRYTGVLIVGP